MRTIAWILMAAALAIGPGCATPPDWIERTLVTVDVTGHWNGSPLQVSGAGSSIAEFWLDLQQAGPKVRGSMQGKGVGVAQHGTPLAGTGSVPIEGTIAGDVFSFRQTNGSGKGELTVRGDEMTGQVSMGISYLIILHRIESFPRPDLTRP
jgi:hypothetical protein